MNINMPDFFLVVPELFVLLMMCVILVADLFISDSRRGITYALSQFTLAGAALLILLLHVEQPALTFSGTYIRDLMGDVLKIFILIVTICVFMYSREYMRERRIFKGEYYVLGLSGVLGMMIMVSAHNFLTIYLGLELLSLTLYSLVAFHRDSSEASEAAMKFFVLGALASGMLLYGMSILYGVTGSLDISEVSNRIAAHNGDGKVLVFGVVFIVIGLAFKFGAVPFHMWIPDVYHGAPTSVTLYIGTAPKIAAFAVAIRILGEALGGLQADWSNMLIVLAVLSMATGNIIAIAQTNLKRMLAYSTISHVGFLLLGILSGNPDGYSAAMFYTLTYALMALGAFGMILLLSRKDYEADTLDDFRGLNERHPWFAFVMMILMFSMAGVPPTVGFYAKLVVLKAVIDINLVWLAVVAVIFSIIGAFYYLRVVKLMYFDKPTDTSPLRPGFDMQLTLSANGLLILGLGIFPGALMALCAAAI